MPRRWFIYLLVLLMGGCGSKSPPLSAAPPPTPTRVVMELAATADLNPNLWNQPSPVQLRIYELKTPGAFDRADFFTLYEQLRAGKNGAGSRPLGAGSEADQTGRGSEPGAHPASRNSLSRLPGGLSRHRSGAVAGDHRRSAQPDRNDQSKLATAWARRPHHQPVAA